jgi:hypothetical protein
MILKLGIDVKSNVMKLCLPVAMIMLSGSVPMTAASIFGTIAGAVKDQSKVPLEGATVTATNAGNQATRTAVSKSDGTYEIPDVDPGMYAVTAQMKGYRDFTVSSLEIKPGSKAVADTCRTISVPAPTPSTARSTLTTTSPLTT